MDSVFDYDQRIVEAFASLQLTPRESEVLLWISRGKSNRDIAVILGTKTGTICKHVEHIFGKLNVENRTTAAVIALETCRSIAQTSKRKPNQGWVSIVGLVTTHLAELWPDSCEIYGALTALIA
jgi:DNA-binding CsgD family transcriptional regulator